MERNDVIKRFNKSSEIGTRTSGLDGLFRFNLLSFFPPQKLVCCRESCAIYENDLIQKYKFVWDR